MTTKVAMEMRPYDSYIFQQTLPVNKYLWSRYRKLKGDNIGKHFFTVIHSYE